MRSVNDFSHLLLSAGRALQQVALLSPIHCYRHGVMYTTLGVLAQMEFWQEISFAQRM